MLRKITEQEEEAYKLRHHEFAGLTTKETAKIMKIAPETVRLLLKSVRAKIPQLFPILTHRQHIVYWLYVKRGLSQYKIADYLHIGQSSVWGILNRVKKKGIPILHSGFGDTVAYEQGMDGHISHKF